MCGTARSAIRCSIGSCVGPSSPTPIESCVNTNSECDFHERRNAQRRLGVIGKHEERRSEGNQPAVRRHAVHRRAHGQLAHAEEHVAPRRIDVKVRARS